MLPSWHNRIYIAISPEHISLVKLGRGLKPKLQAKHDDVIASANTQPSWQMVLDRLAQILDQQEWQNAAVNIVLSNLLVRYAIMPFNAQLQNYSAQEAFARHSLVQIYGAAAEQWELRIQHGKAGAPCLVTAVDRALLEGLRQACATHKLKLHSVTPYLMPVFNHYRKAIENDPAWLVINEPGYSLFALLSGNELVATNGVSHDSINELPALLDRENLVGTFFEPCRSAYVYAPSGDQLSAMSVMGYEFNKLDMTVPDGFPSYAEGLFAMAMSGIL